MGIQRILESAISNPHPGSLTVIDEHGMSRTLGQVHRGGSVGGVLTLYLSAVFFADAKPITTHYLASLHFIRVCHAASDPRDVIFPAIARGRDSIGAKGR
jgi:hypothetical protein